MKIKDYLFYKIAFLLSTTRDNIHIWKLQDSITDIYKNNTGNY